MEFQLVQNEEQSDRYQNVWLPVWIESGYELENFIDSGIKRYIAVEGDNDIGTVELIPYNPASSFINSWAKFDSHEFLNNASVYVIEKLVVKKEYQGVKTLNKIIDFLVEMSKKNEFDYYIGLLNPRVYMAIHRFYKYQTIKVEKKVEQIYVPTIISIEENEHVQRAVRKKGVTIK